ncbi:hypothetical protein ACFLQI_02855 [Candidatus Undinarchaeota archaeon]
MALSTNNIIALAFGALAFILLANAYFPNLFLFLIIVTVGLFSKYYKAIYAVSFLIVDMTDFLVVLIFYKLGFSYALAAVFIFGYFYLVTGLFGNEGPTDATSRTLGLLISTLSLLVITNLYDPFMVSVIFVTLSGLIWGTNQIVTFHIINPIYYPIVLCRTAVYWRFLPYLLPFLGIA